MEGTKDCMNTIMEIADLFERLFGWMRLDADDWQSKADDDLDNYAEGINVVDGR